MKILRFAPLVLGAAFFFASCSKKDKPPYDATPEDYVYYSSNDTVYRVKASGGNPEMLFNGTDDASGDFEGGIIQDLAVDPTTGKLAFIALPFSSNADGVFVGNRDGSGTLTKIADGKENGTFSNTGGGISFYNMTAANGKVYLECGDAFVGVVNMDGTGVTKLYQGLTTTRSNWLYNDLAVDPTTNTLYSLGDTAIWKISLAANGTLTKVASDNSDPANDTFNGYHMTFRKATEELFFVNTYNNKIYKAKTDGSNYSALYTLNGDGYAIVVDEQSGDLYVTEDNTIYKFSSGGTKTAIRTVTALGTVAYY